MGKTGKWFRSLLGSKKSAAAEDPPPREKKKKKREWAFSKSAAYKFKNEDPLASPYLDGLDANKHAIAVAAATAAVAEAAITAAHAAAEVVRLTSGGGRGRSVVPLYDRRRTAAVIKIQSAFRAFLARRALRALKGLVKLQALVRGHIVRKQSADMLRRMQAMARIQARASSHRSYISDFSKGAVNPKNYHQWSDTAKHGGYITKSRTSNIGSKESSHMAPNWLNHWIEQYSWNNRQATSDETIRGDDERSDKILEVDTWKPRQTTRRSDRAFPMNETGQECPRIISLPRLSAKLEKLNPSKSSEEVSSVISAKEAEQATVWTAESSPRVHSASSRPNNNLQGMFTPTRSLYGDYPSHPNYMAYTELSRAKVRSQSAPKQRMQPDELGVSSAFGWSVLESDTISEKGYAVPANHRSHAYVNRQGSRAPGVPKVVSSSYGYRF